MKTSVLFESSRGCWWGAKKHCTFCGLNGTTMAFRQKSAERVYQEVFDLSRRYRNLTLAAVDNILDMRYFHELLPRLAEQDHDLALFYEVKANLTREQVRMMAAAGITQIQPGIESLNSALLRLMNKGVTAIQNIQLLKWCREFGIEPLWNILYSFPGEQAEQYADYPRIMRCLFHLRPPSGISPVIFERFSPYHFDREKYGLTLSPLPDYRFLYPSGDIDLEKVAYYFDGTCPGLENRSPAYIGPITEAYQQWLAAWKSGNVIFQYEVGPGFLILYDNRSDSVNGERVTRRQILNELQSVIYLFCDEVRSVGTIMEKLSETQPRVPDEQSVRLLLAQFVEQGLMFGEGDRFLSLAVRKQPQRAYGLGRPKERLERKFIGHGITNLETPVHA
jgi:ribosomal peptide maturation radical SAM protein 1